ncbi:barstar family protein [Streptomyces erythrochromogenes]|uniref:barstar family protein n=1 Tax=Streptomyces erythrochromogenes TaxID=285574 RepID=UPI0037F26DF0
MSAEKIPFDVSLPVTPWVVFGPRGAPVFGEQIAALEAKGGRVYHFQAVDFLDRGTMFAEFAAKLGFPAYFGRNWPALVDCLDDLHGDVTGGVGVVCVIHGADVLLDSEDLRDLVSILCLAADRANTEFDLDGDPRDRPVVIEHFVFLLDEVPAREFADRIDEPENVISSIEGNFVTAALDLEAWRPYS